MMILFNKQEGAHCMLFVYKALLQMNELQKIGSYILLFDWKP